MKVALVVCAIVASFVASALFAADVTSHPLFTMYPGSKPARGEVKEFDSYKLVTSVENGNPTGIEVRGKVTRLAYHQPAERSILEVFRNYESAFVDAGMEVLFTCEGTACGPAYAASAWNRFNGMAAKSGADCRYVAGKIERADATAYVALLVGKQRHDIDIVEVRAMESGLVVVDADALARGIERDGRVVVDGIFFDTDKAVVKPESKPALGEIARLMERMPELSVWVVGHTDDTGTFERNLALSAERARAVVQELVGSYGIAASRLAAHGVGPLAPESTNRNDAGRAKNRRVELVEQ